MTFPAVQSFTALAVNSFLAAYVLWRNPRGRSSQIFGLFALTFVVWDLGEGILRLFGPSMDPASQIFWMKVEWSGISAIPGVLIHFVLSYPSRNRLLEKRLFVPLLYVPSAIYIPVIWSTDLMVAGVIEGSLGPSASLGPIYPPSAIVYNIWITSAVAYLMFLYFRSDDATIKQRSKILLYGLTFPVVAGSITEVYWPFFSPTRTVFGLGSLYTVYIAIFTSYAIARYQLLLIEPATERFRPAVKKYNFQMGWNYMVIEKGRDNCYGAFREMVADAPGLCITGVPPIKIVERYGLERTPVVWLSRATSGGLTLKPQDMNFEVLQTVLKFMKENKRTAVLVDDLEYLSLVNGFDSMAKVLRRLTNIAGNTGSTLLMSVDAEAFEPREMAILRGTFDRVQIFEGAAKRHELPHKLPELATPVAILIEGGPGPCFEFFVNASTTRRSLCVTTTYPEKLRQLYGLSDQEFLWISEMGSGGYRAFDPKRLDLEATKAFLRFAGESKDLVICFPSMEHLVLLSGFPYTVEFLKTVVDVTSTKKGIVLASVDAKALSRKEMAVLEKRFDAVWLSK